jgi:repressor LexA
MPLTRQQQVILDAILFFIRKGELPTVREVGALVGLRSPATVLKHLRALEQAKIISINGKSRGIRLVTPIESPPGFGESALGARSRTLSFPTHAPRIPLVGAIAAGRPFESYSDGFVPDGVGEDGLYQRAAAYPAASCSAAAAAGNSSPGTGSPGAGSPGTSDQGIPIDPRMFVESGEVFALQVEGDSMVNAGILSGDYVIIRRQNEVEEGEIAAVIINGEGTLKRWRTGSSREKKSISLVPANERFEPIEISEDDGKDVLVLGKYVGLVRGALRVL